MNKEIKELRGILEDAVGDAMELGGETSAQYVYRGYPLLDIIEARMDQMDRIETQAWNEGYETCFAAMLESIKKQERQK